MTASKIVLLFEPEPFYNRSYEDALPATKEEIISHFEILCSVVIPLGKDLDGQYKTIDTNIMITAGLQKGAVQEVDLKEYELSCKFHQKLMLYYGHLLIACKRVHGIWLNDYIPVEYREPEKKKRKKK